MMRSLYSGVAGLTSHQTKMDVIGNNIANVNTTAYKSQTVNFSDLIYQTTQAASGANGKTGGINAKQIGLGVKTASFKTNIEQQGAAQTTNNPFDLMISGSSFFVVSNGNEKFFTRDGSFYVDGAGNLVMKSNGYKVLGWTASQDPQTGDIKVDSNTDIGALQIMGPENLTSPPEATKAATFEGNIDSNDTNINSDAGKIVSFSFYDNKGYSYTAKFSIKSTDDATKFDIKLDSILDPNGKELDDTAFAGVGFGTDKTSTLEFNPATGVLVSDKTVDLTFDGSAGLEAFSNITIDFSSVVNFDTNGTSTIVASKGDKDSLNTGRSIGEMTGITISNNGLINGTYSNGQSRVLGQIATANFANASGLSHEGDNLYAQTLNSGDATIQDITINGDYMSSGVLEMSNVDLSREFTEMITTQRGFQANSRIITVSDSMLEELTNLKR